MKFIKNFSLFENLESEIDLKELEEIIIDFRQMNLDHDIKVGSSQVIDWSRVGPDQALLSPSLGDKFSEERFLNPNHGKIDSHIKQISRNSLSIEFIQKSWSLAGEHDQNLFRLELAEAEAAWEMTCEYLEENYGLRPNYILTQRGFTLVYFKDFQHIKAHMETELAEIKKQSPSGVNQWGQRERVFGSDTSEYFYSTKLTLGFWK